MRVKSVILLTFAALLAFAPIPRAQQPAPSDGPLTLEEVADRVNRAEGALTVRVQTYRPLVEVYIQNLIPDEKLGTVPVRDEYFLGQFDWNNGPKFKALSAPKGSKNFTSSIALLPTSSVPTESTCPQKKRSMNGDGWIRSRKRLTRTSPQFRKRSPTWRRQTAAFRSTSSTATFGNATIRRLSAAAEWPGSFLISFQAVGVA